MKINRSVENILLLAFCVFYLICIAVAHGLLVMFSGVCLLVFCLMFFSLLSAVNRTPMDSVLILITAIIFLSFVKLPYQLVISLIVIFVCMIMFWNNRQAALSRLNEAFNCFISQSLTDKLVWGSLLLLILPLGLSSKSGFFAFDMVHPINDLSIGNAYGNSIFRTFDLAYAGMPMKTYFLGTRLPQFFANIFQVPILEAAFFMAPLFFIILFSIIIPSFFKKYPGSKTPLLILFFLPLLSSHFLHYQGFAVQAFFHSFTYSFAFLFVVLAIYCLVEMKYFKLIFVACLLLLTKTIFFVTLAGGIFLYFLRRKELARLFYVFLFMLPVSLFLFKFFVSGSHSHNLWIIFPAIVHFKIPTIFASGPIIINKARMSTVLIPIILYSCVIYTFINERNNKVLQALAAFSLSGIIGMFILSELTEFNALYFEVSVSFATVIVFWHCFNKSFANNRVVGRIAVYALYILTVISIFFSPTKNVYLNYHSYRENHLPSYQKDLIKAYTWLGKNIPDEKIVIFGKHYEYMGEGLTWESSTSFIRSAVSGKQFYNEAEAYRGIVMQEDFGQRFANTINFYRYFTYPSHRSEKIIGSFYLKGFGESKGNPLVDYVTPQWKGRLLYTLSFGNQWSGLNITERYQYQLKQLLIGFDKLNKKQQADWAINFLKQEKISFIVLENNDKPTPFLLSVGTPVYNTDSIIIYEVNNAIHRT